MINKYSPSLNSFTGNVLYFNFAFSPEEFLKSIECTNTYQAFDSIMTQVLAQANSYSSLQVGVSNITIRNVINWHLGTNLTINGEVIHS